MILTSFSLKQRRSFRTSPKTVVIHLGCTSDPRFLLGMPKEMPYLLFERAEAPDAIPRLRDNTSLLPANRELAIGEVELRDSFRREECLKQVLQTLHYDYVILDCPPNLGLLVVNALVAANLVIVPVSTTLAYRRTSVLFEIMSELKSVFNASWDIRAADVLQTRSPRV